MSTVNFCSNPVSKKVATEVTKTIKHTPVEMKPFPELCKEAAKREPQKIEITNPYISPFAPTQNQKVTNINKKLATAAAENTYPPAPFN